MADYVHTGIVALVLRALQKLAPELAERYAYLQETIRSNELIPASEKTELLRAVIEHGGPELLLAAGAACKDERSTPLLFFLLNSSGPKGVIEKLQRYDEYFHSAHRLVVVNEGTKFLEVAHVSRRGGGVPAPDDLFSFTAIINLLEAVGCVDVTTEWVSYGDEALKRYGHRLWEKDVPKGVNSQWVFRWQRAPMRSSLPGLDDYLLSQSKMVGIAEPALSMRKQVEEIITQDLSRTWSISEVAAALKTSVRTLQRRLRAENVGFSRILMEARVDQSARMLRDSKSTLTEVGLMSGFSDAAHFSREFKKLKGCPPSVYRDKIRFSSSGSL